MASNALAQTWKTYQDAWAAIPAEERDRLLAESVAQDCTFINPAGEGSGFAAMLKSVIEFQPQFPGTYFRTHKLQEQHGRLVADWMMYNGDGSDFMPGTSYARVDGSGKLVEIVAFWVMPK